MYQNTSHRMVSWRYLQLSHRIRAGGYREGSNSQNIATPMSWIAMVYLWDTWYLTYQIHNHRFVMYRIPDLSGRGYLTSQIHDTWLFRYMILDLWDTWYLTCQIHDIWLSDTWYLTCQIHDTWLFRYMIPSLQDMWYPIYQTPNTQLARYPTPNLSDTRNPTYHIPDTQYNRHNLWDFWYLTFLRSDTEHIGYLILNL